MIALISHEARLRIVAISIKIPAVFCLFSSIYKKIEQNKKIYLIKEQIRYMLLSAFGAALMFLA